MQRNSVSDVNTMNSPAGVVQTCALPSPAFEPAWSAIKIDETARERLLAQALLSLTVRQQLSFEQAPLHGLVLLEGPPGTGKTSLARGLANEVARRLPRSRTRFVEIDPHALTSSALGRSQQAVAKLFDQTLPEMAMGGVAIVLLDELETLAVSRKRLSMETNPIDVHRATDAALAGMDRLTREHRNVLLIATTNFPEALDDAVISRADHIERIGLPGAEARREIIEDTLAAVASAWPKARQLAPQAGRLAQAADGLDGRSLRKAIFSAMAADVETAKDPNRLTASQIEAAFRHVRKAQKEFGR
jgi:AAA+ superfamily predicted ATPase